MRSEFVDVVLPVHDPCSYLSKAIKSVKNQSYSKWILWIVNDGDKKNTQKLRQSYKEKQVKVIENSMSKGPPGARMSAIKKGESEFISFIDQDDIWCRDKLEKQVSVMLENSGIGATYSDIIAIDEKGERLEEVEKQDNEVRRKVNTGSLSFEEVASELFKRNFIRLVSTTVRRDKFESIGGFRTDLFGGEDRYFWVTFSSQYRVIYLRERLIMRRFHNDNTSSKYRISRMKGLLTAIKDLKREVDISDELGKRKINSIIRQIVLESIKKKDHENAMSYATELRKRGRISWKNAVILSLPFVPFASKIVNILYE